MMSTSHHTVANINKTFVKKANGLFHIMGTSRQEAQDARLPILNLLSSECSW